MLSKNKIKFFNSLKLRKFRKKHNLFIAEGEKLINELLNSELKAKYIISVSSKENLNETYKNTEILQADYSDIKKISNLVNPPELIGIFNIPGNSFSIDKVRNSLNLFCDEIQNPGNLGTIIRTADWFGIKNLFCSENSADAYAPKVIQATMGAVASVKVFYVNSEDFFSEIAGEMPVFGTFLDGDNIYNSELSDKGIIVIGNEGKGISGKLEKYITKRLYIPSYNKEKSSESLNAGVAAGIVCSEFLRRK